MLQSETPGGRKSVAWFVLVRMPELMLALLVAVLVVFLSLAVIGRYLFDIGIAWSDELARMLFVWVVFVGFAVGIRHRGNIGVELVIDRLSPRKRRWALALQDFTVLAFSIFFAWQALVTFKFSLMQRLPVMQVTIGWLYAAVLVAGLMMVGYAAANLVDSLRGKAGGHADEAGADAMRRSE
jgi:TRAP-type C4-dicarboxylate transport system permease small subunit